VRAALARAVNGTSRRSRGLAPVTGTDWMNFPERPLRQHGFDPRTDKDTY
jgi:hypothetical protein